MRIGQRLNLFLLELAVTIPGRSQGQTATLSHWRFREVCSSPGPSLHTGRWRTSPEEGSTGTPEKLHCGRICKVPHSLLLCEKGLMDVRIVCNGTGCRLNKSVWAPHFLFPTVRQTLRSLLLGYSQCDLDIGEMFLNFLLNDTMKEMSGVDVQRVRLKNGADTVCLIQFLHHLCLKSSGLSRSQIASAPFFERTC